MAHTARLASRSLVFRARYSQATREVFGAIPLTRNELPNVSTSEGKATDPAVTNLLERFRRFGHLQAKLDPLNLDAEPAVPELENLSLSKKKSLALNGSLAGLESSIDHDELVTLLQTIYCGGCSLEAAHIEDPIEREWVFQEFEKMRMEVLSKEAKSRVAETLLKSQTFDKFVGSKFPTVKRYSGEGAESMITFCDFLFEACPSEKIKSVVIGIAHRGRLNLLTTLLDYPSRILFRKMKGLSEFPDELSSILDGDVLSHKFTTCDLSSGTRVTLLPNPSHLEAINGACLGKTRSKQRTLQSGSYGDGYNGDAVCLLIHGDGAFTGQGIVSECFSMAYAPQFSVGGTIHLITNNQLGFTMKKGRSSRYASDIAKSIGCPILHINVDCPEDAAKAAQLALKFRNTFHKDIVVDMICFRRWGHNELDDASLTQPRMYDVITTRPSVPDQYCVSLESQGDNEIVAEASQLAQGFRKHLDTELQAFMNDKPSVTSFKGNWRGYQIPQPTISTWNTGVDLDVLRFVGSRAIQCPDAFNMQEKLRKTLSNRLEMLTTGEGIDWGTAESLAVGSLLLQGHGVRISGQDVGRGTFSHRHMQLVDQTTEEVCIPLNHLVDDLPRSAQPKTAPGKLEIANSILSEEAVLGFEYGMSIDNPRTLVIWEAQFGDFFNGAQIIIDTLISSGETKWLLQSGLVMLLPHGLDGMGPEHSSCRIERFLQLTDSDEAGLDSDRVNMFVVNPSTPAQYFHLLREQQVRDFRKPLIVVAPKKLLRDPECTSTLADFAPSTHFHPVLSDPEITRPDAVKKVIFVSGKMYYTVRNELKKRGKNDTAVVRLERLCPFPANELQKEIARFSNCDTFIWCQEECRNSGAWSFVEPRFRNVVGAKLSYIGRPTKAVPASGIGSVYNKESEAILAQLATV